MVPRLDARVEYDYEADVLRVHMGEKGWRIEKGRRLYDVAVRFSAAEYDRVLAETIESLPLDKLMHVVQPVAHRGAAVSARDAFVPSSVLKDGSDPLAWLEDKLTSPIFHFCTVSSGMFVKLRAFATCLRSREEGLYSRAVLCDLEQLHSSAS